MKPVNTEAKKRKNTRTKHVAPAPSDELLSASSSTKSPCPPQSALDVPTTKQKADPKLAKFLVAKFVPEHLIEWGRDMSIACKLAKAYPNETFWRNFAIRNQVPSMAVIYTPESRRRIKRFYDDYEKLLQKQKEFVVDESAKAWKLGEKCGDDFINPRKKQTLREFLK